ATTFFVFFFIATFLLELLAKPVAVHFCHKVSILLDAGCVRDDGIDSATRANRRFFTRNPSIYFFRREPGSTMETSANLRSFYKIFVMGRSLVCVNQFLNISHIFPFVLFFDLHE
ncbi:MAG: hypothetical protein ACI4V7_09130, partial [Succinivibrionaceae bacterium]